MRALLIAPYYIHWHYGRALRGIVDITNNLIWFLWNFFSIGLLLQTLFAPWQRLEEDHKRVGLNVEAYVSSLMLNTVMRFVGFVIRLIFILIGFVAIIFVTISGSIVFVVWLALPGAIAFVFIFGFTLLFQQP
jgi:hypothetical protein